MNSANPTTETTHYDVCIIGGGAAGMMAAGRAVERGLSVCILEKNDQLGKKLLITGGGRCNITNAEYDTHAFLSKLGKTGHFLHSTFAQFDVKSTFAFFESKGLELKIEEFKRAFPADDKSASVLRVLELRLRKVAIRTSAQVTGFIAEKKSAANTDAKSDAKKEREPGTITGARLKNGEVVRASHFILATGGTSHPETGSTGDAYAWLKEIGHTVIIPEPSLVPIAIRDPWVKELQGITLSSAKLTVFQENKKQLTKKGRLLFTHFGISGPTVINMSRDVGELLKWGEVDIEVDLLPDKDYAMLNAMLQELFDKNKNKLFKNCITEIIPGKTASVVTRLAGINPDTAINSITREERLKLVETIKHMKMKVENLLGPDASIVTSGGVACEEVDFKTMRSRLYPNLLFTGDILNIERPSGGYSLQICWSTGWVAGSAIEVPEVE